MLIKDEKLNQEIQAVHRHHPAYGHRSVALELGINHKRAHRVMTKYNLRPPRRRTKPSCTRSTPHHTYNNLLKGQLPVTHAHHVWSSDLTRLVYRGTAWYLATIEDVATRQIIAKQVGKRHDSQLVLTTLKQAVAIGHTPQILHSN